MRKNLKTTLFGLAVICILVSCVDDTPVPEAETEQFKVVVVNEGATHDFTQHMFIGVAGTDVMNAEVTGTVWDKDTVSEGDEWSARKKYFIKKADVPSAATYKTTNDLNYLRYHAMIMAKEDTESTMRTRITFYRAGERIGEKIFTISGKGGELAVDYHDDYNMFEFDNYIPF